MTRRRTTHGIGHRIGNRLSQAIFWICMVGIPLKSCGH